jgi:hypothetical protein
VFLECVATTPRAAVQHKSSSLSLVPAEDASDDQQVLEIYTISIVDSEGQSTGEFAIGKYAGTEESIPPNFAAVEEALQHLRGSSFAPDSKPCHFAPID